MVWLKGPNVSSLIKRDYVGTHHFDITSTEEIIPDWTAIPNWNEIPPMGIVLWSGTYSAPIGDTVLIAADAGVLFLYDISEVPIVRDKADYGALDNRLHYYSVRRGLVCYLTERTLEEDLLIKAWL